MHYYNLAIAALAAANSFTTVNASVTECVVQIAVHRPLDNEDIPSDFDHETVECERVRDGSRGSSGSNVYVPLTLTEFQRLELDRLIAEGKVVPNESTIRFNSGNKRTYDSEISLPADVTFASLLTNRRQRNQQRNRQQGDQFGVTPTLVIKVIDSTGKSVPQTLKQLSEKMWGPDNLDSINVRNQFFACSHGTFDFIPGEYPGSTGDWSPGAPGVIEVNIDIPFNGSSQDSLRKAATVKAQKQLGVRIPGPFEYVMYAFEDCYGSRCISEIAYSYLNSWKSVYFKNYITYPAVVMHELGHNFGLQHSGIYPSTLGDHTCLMGNPLFGDQLGKMCYNAPKSWEIGWYNGVDDKIDFNPANTTQWSGKLLGITDYDNNNRQGEPVLVRVDNSVDLVYINFNRAIGMTSQMGMAPDKVCVYAQWAVGGTSWIIAQLAQGEKYSLYKPLHSEEITIKVNSINLSANPGFADIQICVGWWLCRTPAPIRKSTPPPSRLTLTPTQRYTPAPVSSPTVSLQPTSSPTPVLTLAPSASCVDDESFKLGKGKKTCKSLEKESDQTKTCNKWDKKTGRRVRNNCPKTCDFCEGRCEDDSIKFKIGEKMYKCAQLEPEKDCEKISGKGRVDEICRATCDFCSVGPTIFTNH